MKLRFVEVDKFNKIHIDSLYEILKKRQYNISHRELPDYNTHKLFVENINYRKWNLIYNDDQLIGNYYINYENFIGINLLVNNIYYYQIIIKEILSIESPLPEIKSKRNKYFLINSSPQNKFLNDALKLLNFRHIQSTYLCK